MPGLPMLYDRGAADIDPDTGATHEGRACAGILERGGVTVECRVQFDALEPWQILFDSRDTEGRGMLLQLTDRGTVKLSVCGHLHGTPGAVWGNSLNESSWECDAGLSRTGTRHHLVFILDGGPKTVSVLVDGVLCDGADERQFGWGRFHPNLKEVNGAEQASVAPPLQGEMYILRIYDRYQLTSEAVANYRSFLRGIAGMVRSMGDRVLVSR